MRTVKQWAGFLIIHLFPKRYEAGIRVIFTDPDADRERCIVQLKAAFALLLQAPSRYRLLRRRIRFVVVWAGDYCYADYFGGVHLPAEDILGVSTHALASVLIHEATHIRVNRMGIPFRSEYRARIETLCVEAQAAFLRCAPDNPDDSEDMARSAELMLQTPWWTEADNRSNRERVLEKNDVPEWIRRIVRGARSEVSRGPEDQGPQAP